MITFKPLYGRLGEIIWMIYGLYYVCIENDISLNEIKIPQNRRGYDYFMNKSYPILENIEIFENIKNNLVNPVDDEYMSYNWQIIPYHTFKITGILNEYMANKHGNYLLTDYWTVPYNRKLFHALFRSKTLICKLSKKYKKIDFSTSCSLHIRRGDFVKISRDLEFLQKNPWAKNKCAASVERIYDEIEKQKKTNNIENFLCFSDDIKWCKENLSKYENIVFIDEEKPCYAMTMIGMCKYHIILNDSLFNRCGIYLGN